MKSSTNLLTAVGTYLNVTFAEKKKKEVDSVVNQSDIILISNQSACSNIFLKL